MIPITIPVSMKEFGCIVCGIKIWYPEHYDEARRADHKRFSCPNGHEQHFPGVSLADQVVVLKQALERIKGLEVGVILNKHSLELAIEIAKTALK